MLLIMEGTRPLTNDLCSQNVKVKIKKRIDFYFG